MKLLKLIVRNFRGLKGENEIDFENSNIIFLIGQNNVGKSTFLHAYDFFVSSKKIAQREDFYNYNNQYPIEIEGLFLKEDLDDENTDFVGTGRNQEPDWVNNWVDDHGHIRIKKVWNTIGADFNKYTYSPNQEDWVQNGFGGFASLFSKYAPQPIFINAMEDEASLEDKVNKLISDRYLRTIRENNPDLYNRAIASIKELQNAITSSANIEQINTDINTHFSEIFSGLRLKIEATNDENIKPEDAFKKNHTMKVERNDCDRSETFLQNGHGVIRQALFNFVAFMNEHNEATGRNILILFEEPELFLHPKLIFKLRKSLYDMAQYGSCQVLCATHSPMMIDISKHHSSLVRIVKDNDGVVHTYQAGDNLFASDQDTKDRVQMINRMNPHICEAFYADKVLLVEGDTETIVYRHLLDKFYPNSEVYVLNTGSKMNIPFFQRILTHFRIEHYPIHDMDTELLENGNHNPAWTLNNTIWGLVEEANAKQQGLSRRYVHNAYFENAHHYRLNHSKDKPLSAYKYAKSITGTEPVPDCLRWLNDIMGDKVIDHNPTYLDSNSKTVDDVNKENQSYQLL